MINSWFKTVRNAAVVSLTLSMTLTTTISFAGQAQLSDDSNYQKALDKMAAERAKKPSKSKLTDDDHLTMEQFTAKLKKELPNPGIAVGQKVPMFTLANAFGQPISLKKELKKGPVVLVFYRGSWCPYCNLHLNVLKNAKPEFAKYNAQVIAVTPQQPDRSAEQIEKDGYPFEVLSDISSKVMKDFGLYFELSEKMQAIYQKFNLDLESYNGSGRNVLPIPGSFVIDQTGTVVAMQAQVDYKARMEPADILLALEQLKK